VSLFSGIVEPYCARCVCLSGVYNEHGGF